MVLREKRRDDLVVRDLGLSNRVRPDVGELSGAHVEQRDFDEVSFAIEPDDVAVDVVQRHDALLFADLFDRPQLIAIDRSELETHLPRGPAHSVLELARQLVVASLEKLRDGIDLLGVPNGVDREHTRGRTALDLVLEARAFSPRKLDVAARAELEVERQTYGWEPMSWPCARNLPALADPRARRMAR